MGLGGRVGCQKPSQEQAGNASCTHPGAPPPPQRETARHQTEIASVTCSLLSAKGSILMGDQGPQEQYYIVEKVTGGGYERDGLSEPSTCACSKCGQSGEAAIQGLGRGLLELVSRHLLCLWRSAQIPLSRRTGNFKSSIPSFPPTGWC